MSHNFFKDIKAYTGVIYLGDPTVDGSWRIIIVGDNLEIQKRVAMADVFEMEKTQTKLKEKV